MDIRLQNRRAAFAFKVITLLAVVGAPVMWTASGVICARHARHNGIRLRATPAFSLAMGSEPAPEVRRGEREFNEPLRDRMMALDGNYFQEVYGVDEGISWFFFALGVNLAR